MKLSTDLISQGIQSLSPTGDRTLSLRDSRISVIANLGATKDDFDCIDLSNNDIIKLENFPLLPRLKTLIVAGNNISKIADGLIDNLPNLTSIVLTGNSIATLSDLEPLFKSTCLQRITLLDNHVVAVPHFRELLIYKIPTLKYLNFTKVTMKERESANALFTTKKGKKILGEIGSPPE